MIDVLVVLILTRILALKCPIFGFQTHFYSWRGKCIAVWIKVAYNAILSGKSGNVVKIILYKHFFILHNIMHTHPGSGANKFSYLHP